MANIEKGKFFDDKFNLNTINCTLLPFFHSCDAFFFRSILEDKSLAPSRCTIFIDENLVYLFYGKPAYKNSDAESSGLLSRLPVTFIFKSASIDKIKRIAPFDTGAYATGLYKDYLHSGMKLDSFFVTPQKQAISKIVSYFFENNENYFSSKPKIDLQFDALEFEIQAYHELIKSPRIGKADDRKASIEVQLSDAISLSNESLEAVIIPEIFLNSSHVQAALTEELGAEVITYESYGIPSDNYYSEVVSLTKQYLIKKQYLNVQK